MQTYWKIGDLAKRVNLSVRTLHYYDEIGLLKPSMRTEADHRLYTEADIIKLQQIVSLRQLGFCLEEIKNCLNDANFEPKIVLKSHINKLHRQIKLQQELVKVLEGIYTRLEESEVISVTDLFRAIEVTKMLENMINKHYTPEQLEYLDRRKKTIGDEAIKAVEKEWQNLFTAFKLEMEKGTDPSDEKVLALARRSQELIAAFTGGDAGIDRSLNNLVNDEYSTLQQEYNFPDSELSAYMNKAQTALMSQ